MKPQNKLYKFSFISFSLLSLFIFSNCKYGIQDAFFQKNLLDNRSNSIESYDINFNPTNKTKYNILVISDLHIGSGKEIKQSKLIEWIEALAEKPAFCIVLGDVSESGKNNEYETFLQLQTSLQQYFPVYNTVGNHDLYNNGWKQWSSICPPNISYYRLMNNTISYYFLDTGSGTMGKKQLEDMQNKMKNDSNKKIVFTHYPLKGNGIFYFKLSNDIERAKMIDTFIENNVKYYFEGHYHPGTTFNFGAFQEYVVHSMKDTSWTVISIDETLSQPVVDVQQIYIP